MLKKRCAKLLAWLAVVALVLAGLPGIAFAEVGEINLDLPESNIKYGITPLEMEVVDICSPGMTTFALDSEGNLWEWTHENFNQRTFNEKVIAVDSNGSATFVALENGAIYGWGAVNGTGGLYKTPQLFGYVDGKIEKIIAFENSGYALCNDGTVWGWTSNPKSPRIIFEDAMDIFYFNHNRGDYGFYVILNSGEMYATSGRWGIFASILFDGDAQYYDAAKRYRLTSLENVKTMCAAVNTMVIVTDDNVLSGWGANYKGMLGTGNFDEVVTFTEIQSNVVDTAIPRDSLTTILLDENGNVYSAGWNYMGLLGYGSEDFEYEQPQFSQIESLEDVVKIVPGSCGFYAFTSNGDVWAWGSHYNESFLPLPKNYVNIIAEPVLIFASGRTNPGDDEFNVTVTETWADDSQADVTNTYTVTDGNPLTINFTTSAGYTANVECDEPVTVDYDAGTIKLDSVTADVDITITYTPDEPDTFTVTVREIWADGSQEDVLTPYTVQPGRAWSALWNTPDGYTAAVECAEPISVNYDAQRLYLYQVNNDFEVRITYSRQHSVAIVVHYNDGILEDQVFTYNAPSGTSLTAPFASLDGYILNQVSIYDVPEYQVNMADKTVYIDSVTRDMTIQLNFEPG